MRSLLCLLLAFPLPALAQLDCIVPTREEGYDSSRPGAESVRRAARAFEAIVKRNQVFMSGNEPVRVRTSISYYGAAWLSASVITTAYNKKAWVAAGCQVSQFADRGGGLADGQIAVYINDPDALLGGRVGDAELPARLAPRRVGELAGFPLYARGDDAADAMVMMSSSNEIPWTSITIAEALDWRERELVKREAEWQKESWSYGKAEAQMRAVYQSMKDANPEGAEKMRVQMERDLARMKRDEARAHGRANDAIADSRRAFDDYRASFSAAELTKPATISSSVFRNGVLRVDDPQGRPIVQVDAARAQREPHRIRLLVIPQSSVATDEDHAWLVAARKSLDYAAVAALLDE